MEWRIRERYFVRSVRVKDQLGAEKLELDDF